MFFFYFEVFEKNPGYRLQANQMGSELKLNFVIEGIIQFFLLYFFN